MQRTLVNEIMFEKEILLQGWVEKIRNQKSIQFIVLRDITGKVQITVEKSKLPEIAEIFTALTPESVVSVKGQAVKNEFVKMGGIEIIPTSVVVESKAEISPIDENTGADQRMDYRWLDLRNTKKTLVFKVQTVFEHAMREFWLGNDFIEIHSPKIISTPSESGSGLFEIKYFNQKAYLAQSPQFYKQMAMASGFEKVFEIGPVFRAEESFTARHTTEFTGIDCEISYINSHYDLMNHQEDLLIYAFKRVKEILGEEINKEFGFEFEVPKKPFPKITMKEAYEILNKNGINKSYEKDGDFDTESEKFMGQYAKEHFGHDFLFVTNYPKTVRPFYHMMNEDDPTTTKSYDLIYKGTEITTGAQREHRYEILKEQALAKGLTLPNIQFYLDFFKYGCPPHGGMGMGLARILMLMLCLYNIRETTYIFRGPTRITP